MLDDKNLAHPARGGGLFVALPAGLGEDLRYILAPLGWGIPIYCLNDAGKMFSRHVVRMEGPQS